MFLQNNFMAAWPVEYSAEYKQLLGQSKCSKECTNPELQYLQ